MLKTALYSLIVFLLLFVTLPLYYLIDTTNSQTIDLTNNKVVYTMPYPGILPDSPLYFVKVVRDRIEEFLTRDPVKKAKFYLLLSDKRMAMTEMLVKKGKDALAVSTLSKAEKYAEKIPGLLITSKKQGVTPPDDLVYQVKLSNAKHLEIIQSLSAKIPQGQSTAIHEVLNLNKQVLQELKKI